MNKTALLHMMHHAAALSDQDVEELEKLVKNFPYCQTAHLLIAKASYDKGNMLSNQKLRKAAAYAPNRHLLKKLIYTTDAAVSLTVINDSENNGKLPQELPVNANNQLFEKQPELIEISVETNSDSLTIDQEPVTTTTSEETEIVTAENFIFIGQEENASIATEQEVAFAEVEAAEKNSTAEIVVTELTNISASSDNSDLNSLSPITASDSHLPAESPEIVPPFESAESFTLSEIDDLLQVDNWAPSAPSPAANLAEIDPELKQLPTDSETNKPSEPAEIIRYELEVPEELEESTLEQTLAHFDSYLFKPERDEYLLGELKPATTEEFIREVYISNQVGYWMGSSRLGELLQVKDELTHDLPLQFYPDLILEYSKQNYLTPTDPPKVTPVSRQFEIIDQFLKSNPKLKSFSNEKMRAEPFDDLAFKSTKNTKNLASENLANILVQQGKIKKAIKIYEHLIVKIPEKKAYFATQIEKLKNQI